MSMSKKFKKRDPLEGWNLDQDGIPIPLDFMAEEKPRNRAWEKRNKSYHYRGVPHALRDRVTALAEELSVTADEVAQVFVEYGLQCIQRGDLVLTPAPNPNGRKMKLTWEETPSSPLDAYYGQDSKPSRTSNNRKKQPENPPAPMWKSEVAYRISTEFHQQIKLLANRLSVPIGELLGVLLAHSLAAHQAGRLHLSPQPVAVKMTLKRSLS